MIFQEIHFIVGNTIINKYNVNCINKTCIKNRKRETWIIKENTHDAIIEKEKYDKVQEIKSGKQAKIKVKHEFLLQDLVYCGHCKRKLQYKIYKSADKKRFLSESSRFNCSLFYKKKCKNNIHIKEKDLNEIIKTAVIRKMNLIEIKDKLIYCYRKNDKNTKKMREYKSEIEKLERKKSVLYKKKCEQDITTQQFKVEYAIAKARIEKFKDLMEELDNNRNTQEDERIGEIISQFKNGSFINNAILKEIINKIEVYSKNKIEITFNI